MKYIILCGGIENKCDKYLLPNPLNYINGKHMIEYIIDKIPSDEIFIIYNKYLDEYNFVEIVINLFKKKIIKFAQVDFLTRGAIETAYIGIQIYYLLIMITYMNIHLL